MWTFTHRSVSSLQSGLSSPPQSRWTPASPRSLSERSRSLSLHEPERMVEARGQELSRVRLQLLNLTRNKEKCRSHPETPPHVDLRRTDLSVSRLAFFRPRESSAMPASPRWLLLRSRSLRRDVLMALDSFSQQFAVSLQAFSLSEQQQVETVKNRWFHLNFGSFLAVSLETHFAS